MQVVEIGWLVRSGFECRAGQPALSPLPRQLLLLGRVAICELIVVGRDNNFSLRPQFSRRPRHLREVPAVHAQITEWPVASWMLAPVA